MYSHNIQLRARYSETDQMGFVYYGNYASYFEVGRVEALRNLGISYKEMESNGIWLPVVNYNINYLNPAKYDDLLQIQTRIPEMPTAKILFEYECRNEEGILCANASTILVFLDEQTRKPIRCPKEISDSLKGYF